MLGERINDDGLVTAYINKFIESEAPFVRQKLAEFVLHILGTEDDPDKQQHLSETFARQFAPYEKKALAAAALFDTPVGGAYHLSAQIYSHIRAIQQRIHTPQSESDDARAELPKNAI